MEPSKIEYHYYSNFFKLPGSFNERSAAGVTEAPSIFPFPALLSTTVGSWSPKAFVWSQAPLSPLNPKLLYASLEITEEDPTMCPQFPSRTELQV